MKVKVKFVSNRYKHIESVASNYTKETMELKDYDCEMFTLGDLKDLYLKHHWCDNKHGFISLELIFDPVEYPGVHLFIYVVNEAWIEEANVS